MRILFCDDHADSCKQLLGYVSEFFQTAGGKQPEFASYSNGDELLASETSADIAFLDVEMPGKSGIHVGARLMELNPRIKIFIVTAYPDYLDEAMRFRVFRYLSKPVEKNRLFRNLKDALYLYNMETCKVPVTTKDGVTVLSAEDIVCVETEGRKTILYTSKDAYQTVDNIEIWREKLTLPCFYSPYRSFIINMKHVSRFTKDVILLQREGAVKEAYLAKRKYTDFKDTYMLYLEGTR